MAAKGGRSNSLHSFFCSLLIPALLVAGVGDVGLNLHQAEEGIEPGLPSFLSPLLHRLSGNMNTSHSSSRPILKLNLVSHPFIFREGLEGLETQSYRS